MSKEEKQEIAQYVNKTLQNYKPAAGLLPLNGENCIQALHDGVLLCYIINCLSKKGQIINQSQLKKTKASIFHKLDQVNRALNSFKSIGLDIINIRSEYIVQKKQNSILGLFNQIVKQKPIQLSKQKKVEQNKKDQHQNVLPSNNQKEQKQPQQEETKSSFIPKENNFQETQTQQIQHQLEKQEHQFILQQQKQKQQEQMHDPEQITQTPISQPVPVQQDPREKIYHLKINSNQYINPEAEKGYNFQHTVGAQVVVLNGSLRKGSVNLGMVHQLQQIKSKKFFQNIYFHIPDLAILPLMNPDLVRQGRIPKVVLDLRNIVRESSGILISTPQYNGSFSGIIKNAFDWLSHPFDASPLTDKKIGVMSASFLTQNQLKDTIQLGQYPRCNFFRETFYINLQSGAFNMQNGILTDQHERDRLAFWYQDFSNFIISGNKNPQSVPRFIMMS